MSITVRQLAKDLGYTGSIPQGATSVKKGDNGELIFGFGNGKPSESRNTDGSIFSKPVDTPPAKPADDGNGKGANGAGAANDADNSAKVDNDAGKGNGASGAGKGAGASGSLFGNGFASGQSDFGMSMFNADGGFEIDQAKFMKASAGLWGALNMTSMIPLGLGSILGQGLIGQAIGNFLHAINFNFTSSSFTAGADNDSRNGTTVTAGDGQPDTSGAKPTSTTASAPAAPATSSAPSAPAAPATKTEQPTEQAPAPTGGSGTTTGDAGATQARPSSGNGYSVSKHSDKVFWKKSGGTTHYYVNQNGKKVEIGGYDGKTYTLNGKTYDAKTGNEIKADAAPQKTAKAQQKPATQKAKVYTGGLNIAHPQLNGNFRENGFLSSLKNLKREYTIETTSSGNVYKYENADGQKMEVRFDKAGKPTKVTTHNGHFGSVYDISYHANGQRKHMTHGAIESASNVVWEDWSYDQKGVTTDYVKGTRVRNKTWKNGQIYREFHAWHGGKQAVSKIPTQVLKGGSGVTFKEGSHLTWSRSGNNFVRKDSASGETWTFDKNGKLIKRQMENGDVKTYNAKGWNYIKKGY